MPVVAQGIPRITGGAERLRSGALPHTRKRLEEANASFRRFVHQRSGVLFGERLAEGARSPSSTCELMRDTAMPESINFGRAEITKALSDGAYLIAKPSEKGEAQVEILTPDGPISGHVYGNQIEPSGQMFSIDALAAWDEIERGATLSVRHIDLYSKSLAFISDELTAISGAGTFAKLFVTGGRQSVSGKHSDPSDVIIIILEGKKHFRIEPPGGVEAKGLDKILKKGDVLLIPAYWQHLVTPLGAICIHVTFGIMHFEYWRQANMVPTHLGFRGLCQDPSIMAGLIPPKNPPLFTNSLNSECVMRTAAPGGLVPISENSDSVSVLGGGRIVSMTGFELQVLASIHSSGSSTIGKVAECVGAPVDKVIEIAGGLARARLVGVES